MIKTITLAILLFVSTLSPLQAAMVNNVDSPTAQKMMKENQKVFLLDVRTPQEYFQTRLTGAHLIPIDKFLERVNEVPQDRPILVYCAVGARSSQVAEYLVRNGYAEVYDLRGGIEAWSKLYRLPVVSGAP